MCSFMKSPISSDAQLPRSDGHDSIKRHGTTLATCDSERVKHLGCIQANGALLVLRLDDLPILQASKNRGN